MGPITVRNLPPEVARAIRRKAKLERLSLNRAVVELLEVATGLSGRAREEAVHHDLDGLSGTWSEAEADEFDAALREQRVVDPESWR